MRGAGERPAFRPEIEGLRAVAVLAVVLFHAGLPGLSGGFVGVDVFFVVSGFLITGMLWRGVQGTGRVRLARFSAARARAAPRGAHRARRHGRRVGLRVDFFSKVTCPPLDVPISSPYL